MSLAQRVRDYRYTKGWGPDELASRASISRTALYQIESGKTEFPRAGTLRRIALALDIPMESLLAHDEEAAGSAGAAASVRPSAKSRRGASEWIPAEGGPLATPAGRGGVAAPGAVDPLGFLPEPRGDVPAATLNARERDLSRKLHELLASPLGEGVGRILDELYRTLASQRPSN